VATGGARCTDAPGCGCSSEDGGPDAATRWRSPQGVEEREEGMSVSVVVLVEMGR
jgi:hypothetical protein